MSRAWTFVAAGLIILVTIWMQRVSIEILGPGSMMWEMVADVQFGTIDGEQWAKQMYEAITVWFMWLIRGAVIAGALYKEFARENVTVQVPVGGPR